MLTSPRTALMVCPFTTQRCSNVACRRSISVPADAGIVGENAASSTVNSPVAGGHPPIVVFQNVSPGAAWKAFSALG